MIKMSLLPALSPNCSALTVTIRAMISPLAGNLEEVKLVEVQTVEERAQTVEEKALRVAERAKMTAKHNGVSFVGCRKPNIPVASRVPLRGSA